MQRRLRVARRRAVASALAAVTIAVVLAVPASAKPGLVTVDGGEVPLKGPKEGARTASVGLTNLTDGLVRVTPRSKSGDCPVSVGDDSPTETLKSARHTSVTVMIPASCDATERIALVLDATAGDAKQSIEVNANDNGPDVDWTPLRAFGYALVVSLILVGVIYAVWWIRTDARETGPLASLKGLDASWSFKDSWLSNTTAAAGVLVLVAGQSSFLDAVLGDNAKNVVGVATVAGLIATALVGAAGVFVVAIRRETAREVSIGGLLAGTAVALGAAGGQIWAVTWLLKPVDLGGLSYDNVRAGAWVATALLLLYAWMSIMGFLKQGTAPDTEVDPFATPVSPEVVAAALAVIGANGPDNITRRRVRGLLKKLEPPKPEAADGDEPEGAQAVRAIQPLVRQAAHPLPLAHRAALP
jgi:uncharacterized membrane protein